MVQHQYKHLERVHVRPLLPDSSVLGANRVAMKRFRRPEDICHYDFALEDAVVARHSARLPARPLRRQSGAGTVRSEEIMRSLNELREDVEPTVTRSDRLASIQSERLTLTRSARPGSIQSDSSVDIPNAGSANTKTTTAAALRMRGQTAAELYLGTDDAGQVLSFIDYYVATHTALVAANPELVVADTELIRAFHLYEGSVSKGVAYLLAFQDLVDLAFPEDRVVSSLLMFDNDRERALDYLMKEE